MGSRSYCPLHCRSTGPTLRPVSRGFIVSPFCIERRATRLWVTRGHTKEAIRHIVNGGRVVDLVAQKRTRSSAPHFHHLLPRTSSDRWSHKSRLCASLPINRGQVTCATQTHSVWWNLIQKNTQWSQKSWPQWKLFCRPGTNWAWLDKFTYRGWMNKDQSWMQYVYHFNL